jgi:glycosyltransferase involved in cell wall biosynthesis
VSVRVLHATPSYAPAYRLGGPVRSLEGLLPALRALGADVRVVTTDDHGLERLDVPRGWQERAGIPVLYLKRWARPDVTPRFFSEVLREALGADVVHVTGVFCVPTFLALAAARVARRPVVLSPRGALEAGSLAQGSMARKQRWLGTFRPLLERVDLFHVTSDKEAASVRKAFGSRVVTAVVPNGTDLPVGDSPAVSLRPVIAALGRIHPVKGYDRLLAACGILAARGIQFDVRIAGPTSDEGYANRLRSMIDELSLSDRAALVGEVLGERRTNFLSAARLLVLPSHDTENFGNVVIEALACGTPVVASRHAPWPALEVHSCGRWVENEPHVLADAIAPYLQDETLARTAGQRGRRLVAEGYSWDGVARRMLEVYEMVSTPAGAIRRNFQSKGTPSVASGG